MVKGKFFMGKYLIRRIEQRDDASVAKIIRDCLIEYGGDNRSDTAWGDPYLDRFSTVYVNDNNAYFVATDETGKVVAGVGVGPMEGVAGVCELQKMYCMKEHRGSGISQRLLDEALSFARGKYEKIYLETLDNMTRAQAFYERNGFKHTDETIGATGHCGCSCHYIKDL